MTTSSDCVIMDSPRGEPVYSEEQLAQFARLRHAWVEDGFRGDDQVGFSNETEVRAFYDALDQVRA